MSYIKKIMKMHGTIDFLDLLTTKTNELNIRYPRGPWDKCKEQFNVIFTH